ncbi:MAG TPA: uroporphyrinogen decarboxylase family protein [Atribacteraceae bacterium]|nr:uroporphyrinogen decarboxylase family protein [Atribacteraceae bacterium]
MNSRERVLRSLDHKEADRVPIDFGGLTTSIHKIGYRRLTEYLGLPPHEAPIIDMFQQIVDPAPALKEKFHADVVGFFANPGSGWSLSVDPVTDSYWDEWGVFYQRPLHGYWYDLAGHPLKEGTLEELKNFKFPDPRDPNRIKGLRDKAKNLNEETDKAVIIYSPTAGVFEHSYWLRGIVPLFTDMAFNKLYVEALAERIVEWQLSFWDYVLEEVGHYVHIVEIGDDLGTQSGPLVPPDLYRLIYKPRHKMLTDLIHKKSKAKVFLHCCGSIYWALPDIVESGVDILNPIQVSAKDMQDTARIKREFGRELVFWGGGADATEVMAFASPDTVIEEVKRRIDDLSPDGGFVFAPIHNIQPNVPPENTVAFFQTAFEYGSKIN